MSTLVALQPEPTMAVSMPTVRLLVLLMLFVASAGSARAQDPPKRPKLAASADTNDWEAYFDRGIELMRRKPLDAAVAFEWAARLDPTRAEAPFAQWCAFWIKSGRDRFVSYLNDDDETLRRPDVQSADSLRQVALQRNPFVHQGLWYVVLDIHLGVSGSDLTRAWKSYATADLATAARRFGLLISRDPVRYNVYRYTRAATFVHLKQNDSAVVELSALLWYLRSNERKGLVSVYQSKELLEYAVGRLYADQRDFQAAGEAFGRASAENAAFAPAHFATGRLAQLQRDWSSALAEFGLAVELEPNDVEARVAYGTALAREGKTEDALKQIRAAIALEPFYAASYLALAEVLDAAGNADARQAYQHFLERAPRSAVVNIEKSQKRFAALGSK